MDQRRIVDGVKGSAINANNTVYDGTAVKTNEAFPSWLRSWLVVAAVWLQVMVVVFIVVRMSQVKTPVIDWVDKMTDLFTETR